MVDSSNNTIFPDESLDQGLVLSIGDGIARVAGLPDIKAGEMVYIFGDKKKNTRIGVKS